MCEKFNAYQRQHSNSNKKQSTNKSSFISQSKLNLCVHKKPKGRKVNVSCNNSNDGTPEHKEDAISPFVKSYSTYTTPRKSGQKEPSEVPFIYKLKPEAKPVKGCFYDQVKLISNMAERSHL